MRILVIGATGYIASRTIPALLAAGHEVIAAARSPRKLDQFYWREQVSVRSLDVLDPDSVTAAVTADVDAIVYLVHGLAKSGFRETDRRAATTVRDAAQAVGVQRLVYVSGIIPDVAESELSEHLASRLEVEQILTDSTFTTITLRAAMVVGAGSTSYALMGQLAQRLPITVTPDWMRHKVNPIAISDLSTAVVGALSAAGESRFYDVGGEESMLYPDLIARYLRINKSARPAFEVPLLPQGIVAEIASRIADVPAATVRALVESLREDMVAADDSWVRDLAPAGHSVVGLDEGLRRALADVDFLGAPSTRDPLGPLPGDPRWANPKG